MKILFLTEHLPFPLDSGGNIRTFHILKALAREHQITLLAVTNSEPPRSHVDELRKLCEVRLVKVQPNGLLRDLWSLICVLAGSTPFSVQRHFRKVVQQELRAIFQSCGPKPQSDGPEVTPARFDAVHFNHLDAALYADDIPPGVVRVLDEHNVVANQIRTTLIHEQTFWRKLVLKWDLAKLAKYEPTVCNNMDACLVCSGDDAQALRTLGARGLVKVIPNGVDLEYFRPQQAGLINDCEAIFVGTMDYDPCEKGVFYFCSEILPLVRREIASFRFVVIGRNPSKRLRMIADSDSAVVLTGRVEDIRPHVYKAGVFVVPLVSGSGTRLKILEAMALGTPIVTTSIGVEGIDAVNGKEVLIADSPVGFASAIVTLLRDRSKAAAQATNARKAVERTYGWTAISTDLLKEYRELKRLRSGENVQCGFLVDVT